MGRGALFREFERAQGRTIRRGERRRRSDCGFRDRATVKEPVIDGVVVGELGGWIESRAQD